MHVPLEDVQSRSTLRSARREGRAWLGGARTKECTPPRRAHPMPRSALAKGQCTHGSAHLGTRGHPQECILVGLRVP